MRPAPRSGSDRLSEADFTHAPTGGRNGPVGAHPRNDGALLERWRAQDGVTRSTIQEWPISRISLGISNNAYTGCSSPAFLSPAPYRLPALTKARSGGPVERLHFKSVSIFAGAAHTARVSELRVNGDDHRGGNALRRELLALHHMRRRLERVANAHDS